MSKYFIFYFNKGFNFVNEMCIPMLKTFQNGFKAIVIHDCIRTSN